MALTAKQKADRAAKAAAATGAKSEAAAPEAVVEKVAIDKSLGPKASNSDIDNSLGAKIQAPAVHEHKVAGGGRTVVVVSRMPRGVYLQLTEQYEMDVKVLGGGIEKRNQAAFVGPRVRLKPTVLEFGMIPNYPIVCGFSLTRDVDANFWRAYYEQNKNLTLITSGVLCAFDNEADATAYCREYEQLRSGLEPIAQVGDPRIESSNNPNLSDVDIDTDSKRPTKAA